MIETSFSGVAEFVGSVVGSADGVPEDAQSAKLAEWTAAINKRTVEEAGLAYATYLRLKISGTVDRYADTVCNVCDFPDDSNHAQLVRSVLRLLGEQARAVHASSPSPPSCRCSSSATSTSATRSGACASSRRRCAGGTATSRARQAATSLRVPISTAASRSSTTRSRRSGGRWAATTFGEALSAHIKKCFPEDGIRTFLYDTGLDADAYLELHRADLETAEKELHDFLGKALDGFSAKLYGELYELSQRVASRQAPRPARPLSRLPALGRPPVPDSGALRRG